MYEIKIISSYDTYVVRHPVLRKGRPLETCVFEGDALPTTKHFGLFYNNQLIGVASLFNNNHREIPHQKSLQLRGMAVLDEFQGSGLGKILLQNIIQHLKEANNSFLLWFNARVSASGFYAKLGFNVLGETFDIPNIGPHYVMFQEFIYEK